jgi:O-antigen ligase
MTLAGAAPPVGRAELVLLAALLFVLPLLEVPKHLLWAAWVVVTLMQLARARGAGAVSPSSGWDAVFLAILVAAALAGTGVPGQVWRADELGDVLRMVSVPWLMMRRGYTMPQALRLLQAALAGALLATAHGVAALLAARTPLLELHSVGHVNHSAIYLAIIAGVALGLLVAATSLRQRLAAALAVLVAGVALLVGASRAAVGAFALVVLLLGWLAPVPAPAGLVTLWRRRFRLTLLGFALLAVLAYLGAMSLGARQLQPGGQSLVSKFGYQTSVGAPISYRDGLHRLAFAAAGAYPLAGIGLDRFRTLDAQRLCTELAPPPPGQRCDPDRYIFREHAHSLYANTVAEQGAVGLIALLALLAGWAWRLVRTLAWARASGPAAAVWIGAFSGLVVTAAAGLLNTTLHHEHGLLAMSLLGLLLAASPPAAAGGMFSRPASP